jgi:hypothetical protein
MNSTTIRPDLIEPSWREKVARPEIQTGTRGRCGRNIAASDPMSAYSGASEP